MASRRSSGCRAAPISRDANGTVIAHKRSGGRGSLAYRSGYANGQLPKDSFTLDGDELVPCDEIKPTASGRNHVPSCHGLTDATALANAYATRVESYMRIRDTGANWAVTARDGTIYTYETFDPAPSFRWVLTQAKDTKGNIVKHVYDSVTAGEDRVLNWIEYWNRGSTGAVASIQFVYEDRSDDISYASGRDLRWIKKRLKTIRVTFGASDVQEYRLASVQEVGLAGGAQALPPSVFSYSNIANGFETASWLTARMASGSGSSQHPEPRSPITWAAMLRSRQPTTSPALASMCMPM